MSLSLRCRKASGFAGEAFDDYLRARDLLIGARADKLAAFPEQAQARLGVRSALVLDASDSSLEQPIA